MEKPNEIERQLSELIGLPVRLVQAVDCTDTFGDWESVSISILPSGEMRVAQWEADVETYYDDMIEPGK